MKTRYLFLCLSLLLLLPVNVLAQSVTVVDQVGREVEVPQPVKRVVSTYMPSTIFALSAGLNSSLVGASTKDSDLSIYEAGMAGLPEPVLVGNRSVGLNLETIVSLAPDLVIMYGQKDGVRIADKLTALGIPAIVIKPETLEDMKKTMTLVGEAAGRRLFTDKVVARMERIENLVASRVASVSLRPKVYYAAGGLLRTVSGDMLQNEMITQAGGENVSRDTRGFFVSITREQLLSWAPDAILCSGRLSDTDMQSIFSAEYASLPAAQTENVFRFPQGSYWDFPSPLSMAGLLWLAAELHPDAFSDVDVQAEIHQLYDTMYGDGFSAKHPYVVGDKS